MGGCGVRYLIKCVCGDGRLCVVGVVEVSRGRDFGIRRARGGVVMEFVWI